MKRRLAVAGLLGLIAAPTCAQQRAPGKIGYLHLRTIAPDHPTLSVLRSTWQALGYVEGETVLLRSADDDIERVPAQANELIGVGAVLIVVGAAAVRAASRTTTTPIVAVDLETDPVRAGFAVGFARPGGNVTGLFLDQPSLAGKWIDLLREAMPTSSGWQSCGIAAPEPISSRSRRPRPGPGGSRRSCSNSMLGNFDDALRPLSGKPRAGIVQ